MQIQWLQTLLLIVGSVLVLVGIIFLYPDIRQKNALTQLLSRLRQVAMISLHQRFVIDRTVYRHHRIAGTAMAAFATLWLWILSPWQAFHKLMELTGKYIHSLRSNIDLMLIGMSICSLLAIGVGILIIIRPSALKPLEDACNHPIHIFRNTQLTPNINNIKNTLKVYAKKMIGLGCLTIGLYFIWHSL